MSASASASGECRGCLPQRLERLADRQHRVSRLRESRNDEEDDSDSDKDSSAATREGDGSAVDASCLV